MAVARSGRTSPPYALIVFIFLWIVSTGAAAYFYVGKGKEDQDLHELQNQTDAVFNKQDAGIKNDFLSNANLNKTVGSRASSALGEANYEIEHLRTKLGVKSPNGKPVNTVDLIRDQGLVDMAIADLGKTAGVDMKNAGSLYDAAKILALAASENSVKAQTAQKALDEANHAYATALASQKSEVEAYQKSNDAMKADVTRLSEQITALHAEQADTESKAQRQVNDIQTDAEQKIRARVTQLNEATGTIESRDRQIAELKKSVDEIKSPPKINIGTEPVGKVVRASLDDKEVWISLGSEDHVVTGLTFAVYDPHAGISLTGSNGKKGDIEVTEVHEKIALARVSHLEKNAHLMPNDVLGNLVFNGDRGRKFHFVVFGDFDLDGDGVTTPQERDKVSRLIQAWGGVVDDKVTTQTDFLILGAEPGSAAQHFSEETDQGQELAKQRETQQQNYQALIGQAKEFSVPILNANRFLSLIGYYASTVVNY